MREPFLDFRSARRFAEPVRDVSHVTERGGLMPLFNVGAEIRNLSASHRFQEIREMIFAFPIEGLDQGNRSAINPGASALVERTEVSITTPALRAALRLYAGQQLGRSALAARLGSGRDAPGG